jgi:predicted O-methyltransferase YrrM
VRHAVEIGTYTGLGSLAILPFIPSEGSLLSFDIAPWNEFPDTFLQQSDFKSGLFRQILGDLTQLDVAEMHADILRQSDLIFVDAAKDGVQERLFLENFEKINLKRGALLVLDDIKVMNMLAIWRGIRRPKLDFTSVGHFTGTGFVLWE